MTSGGISLRTFMMFDCDFPLSLDRVVGVSRAPRPKLSFGNIVKPFSLLIWLCIFGSLGVLCVVFVLIYKTYTSISKSFIAKEDTYVNFLLFTFCKISEPEPLPWFRHGIAGQLSVFLWTLMSLFCIFFYVSNLRAVMVTVEYEKPIDTLQDVVDNGQRVWIARSYIEHE